MDCSLSGSSIHRIFQAIVLEWVAISFSRVPSQPRDRTWISLIVDRCFTIWANREVLEIGLFIYFLLKDNCFTEFCCFVKPQHESAVGIHISAPFYSHLPPNPTPLGWCRAPVWVSWVIQQTPVGYLFYINPIDGGAWWATVHGVPQSRTRLSDFTFTFYFHALEKEMATRSSVLALRIPGTGEPGGLLSMGLHRVGHD